MGGDHVYSVFVSDDHPLILEVVGFACEGHPQLRLAGSASNGMETLVGCLESEPDVVVLDLTLPDVDGTLLIATIKKRFGSKVCVFTGRDDSKTLFDCLNAGADAFLQKDAGVQGLGDTLLQVATGTFGFSDAQRRKVNSYFGQIVRQKREAHEVVSRLSPREKDVLILFREGLTTTQMASRLGVGAVTVESHIGHLYKKLGVQNRVQAMMYAERLGLLDEPLLDATGALL